MKMVRIDEVATIVMGQSPPGKSYNDTGDGLPFFQGKAEFGEISPTPRKWCNDPRRVAEKGDILMSVRAPVGPTNIAGERCCIGRGLAAIRAHPDLMDQNFLRYFLRFSEPRLAQLSQGSTFAAIGRTQISSLKFHLPELSEQRRIVDLLSRAEAIVRLRREAQAKAAELIPALFLDMFGDPASNPNGWPIMPLGDLLVACNYGTSKRANSDGAGVPILRMGNVNYDGSLDLGDIKHVELDKRELARQLLLPGDLLFNRTNSKDLVGKAGLWDGRWPATAASYFIRFRTDAKRVRPAYIWALLNSRHMKRVLFQTARGAIGQSNINMQELKSLMVPVPPVPAQDQFGSHVQSLQSICHQQARALQGACTTLDSLLHRSFAPV